MIYDIFAVLAIMGGIYSGTFFITRALRYYKISKVLFYMMTVYAIFVCYYLAVIYILQFAGVLHSPSPLTLGAYTRPAIGISLWTPALIMGWVERLRYNGVRL